MLLASREPTTLRTVEKKKNKKQNRIVHTYFTFVHSTWLAASHESPKGDGSPERWGREREEDFHDRFTDGRTLSFENGSHLVCLAESPILYEE